MREHLERTPIVDKNGKPTTVHKRPAKVTAIRPGLVSAPPISTPRDERNADIENTIMEAVIDGLIKEAVNPFNDPRSPVREYKTDHFSVGKDSDGNSVEVKVSFAHIQHEGEAKTKTTSGDLINEYWALNIVGRIVSEEGDVLTNGQIVNDLSRVDTEAARTMAHIWREYHLNHQTTLPDSGLEKINESLSDFEQMAERLEERKAGEKWMVKEIDPADFSSLISLIRES